MLRDGLNVASSISGASRLGRPIAVAQVAPLDLVVRGSVAVTRDGARVGKGGGWQDGRAAARP
jgi:5-formyltetrahydrofolate cyclo-ligase